MAVIGLMKRTRLATDFRLTWPPGKTYLAPALLWGVAFGVLMTLVDYAPQLLAHTRPDPGFPLTMSNITGWLLFEGIWVGPTEEIPFRALLVTYLVARMPGQWRLGRFDMSAAGVVVAAMFALLHWPGFDTHTWPEAVGQQIYAFVLGVLYAYWLEKSRSIAAPIVSHNAGDFVEWLLVFAWLGVFHR